MFTTLSKRDRLDILNEAEAQRNVSGQAIEKDWWVCAVLQVLFSSQYREYLFEALVDDELWVSLDDHGMVTQVEQKDFSRGYVFSDETGEGPQREVYVSPARKI